MQLTNARTGRSPSHHRGSVFSIAVFTLFLSLLTPFVTVEVADAAAAAAAELAQGVPPDCEPGFVVSDDGAACVADPNAQQPEVPTETAEAPVEETPVETATATETAIATEIPVEVTVEPTAVPAQAPTTLTIAVHRCTDSPQEGWTPDIVVNQCGDPGSGSFTVSSNVEPMAQTGSGGSLMFNVSGYLTIQETVEPGFGNPVVKCFFSRAGSKVFGQIGPAEAPNGALELGQTDDRAIACDWYQVPADPATTPPATPNADWPNQISMHVANCPDATVDPARGVDALNLYCGRVQGVAFRATVGADYTADAISASAGTVIFEPVPAGAATITETIPTGYGEPIVFCQLVPHTGTFDSAAAKLMPVQDGRITHEVKADHDLSCQWYNVPVTAPATPAASPMASPAAEGTGAMVIFTFNCPAGFDVTTVDVNPRATCETAAGIDFDIDDTIDDDASYQVSTNGAGQGSLDKLRADLYTIKQLVPNGVTSTFVWDCYDTSTDSNRTDPLAMSSAFQTELAEGAAIRCDVFNVTGGSGRVVINTLGCGTDVPAYTLTVDQLRSQCAIDTGGIDFTVVSDRYKKTLNASNNPLQLATFENVPSGSMSVVETLPGGWGTPIVSCQALGLDGAPLGDARFMEIIVGEQIDFALEPGQVMGCDWFNVARGNADARMIVYNCPADFDAFANANNINALATNCTGRSDEVQFAIYDNSRFNETRKATPDAPAYWQVVPSGSVLIAEVPPDGFGSRPLVHCETYSRDANNNLFLVKREMVNIFANATMQYNVSAGQLLQCVWYNVPGDTGYVSVFAQACPEGFDIYNASRIQFEQGCNEAIGTVDFAVASGSFTETDSATDRYNYLDFPSVPTGDLTVKQTSTTEYDTAVVYCYSLVQGRAVTPQDRVEVSADRAVAQRLAANQELRCEWYLAHATEGTVSITKWTCPEPLTPGQERSYYQQKCTQTRDGVDFTVTGIASSVTQTTANGGKAQWAGILPGLVTITETIPEGYGPPVVFCAGPKLDRSFPVANGTIEHELLAGGSLTCDWYNMPLEKGHVVVHKGACPDGTTGEHDAGWYLQNCAQPQEGVIFTLTHGAGSVPGTTDATGKVEWADVPLGPFSIQEQIPSGFGDPIVFCTSEGDTMLAGPASGAAPSGYFAGELTPEAKKLTCHWYNIPAGHNSITVHKYTCPAGYDPHDWNANPTQDCVEATSGITFNVSGPATGIEGTTEDDGSVAFGDLPSGTYTVTETVPDGIAGVFVWDCGGQRMGELRPTPLATGPTLELALDGSEDIVCRWYNVPAHESGYGWMTVIKYHCATTTYTSDVDCEVYEGGQGFDLVAWNGEAWEYHATQTTDGAGRTIFADLPPGQYWLDEHDRDWCHLRSDQLADDGASLAVSEGQETVVTVYNCGTDPGEQGKVPVPPTKYPNTGVPPGGGDTGSPTDLPAFAPLAGLPILLTRLRDTTRSRAGAHHGETP